MTALTLSPAPLPAAPRLRVPGRQAGAPWLPGAQSLPGGPSFQGAPSLPGTRRAPGPRGASPAPGARARRQQPSASVATGPRGAAARPSSRPSSATAPLRLTRRGRLAVTTTSVAVGTAAVLVALGGLGADLATAESGRPAVEPRRAVLVQPGDTLWSLAAGVDAESDRRDVIDEIVRINHLPSSQVAAGQTLLLPAG